MENAVDALKIAFAIIVFMLAFTLFFHMASLARETAEKLVIEADRTTYYTYQPEPNDIQTDPGTNVVTKTVTLEEMIPTIYRYSIESYGVTIIDRNGQIVTRFDKETENFCNYYDNYNAAQKQLMIDEINNYILRPVGANLISGTSDLEDIFERIYGRDLARVGLTAGNARPFEASWHGDDGWIAQRIDADLSGERAYFGTINPGVQSPTENLAKVHIPCLEAEGGLMGKYGRNNNNTRFKEYLIVHDGNIGIRDDDGELFFIGITAGAEAKTTKREIIYVEIN